MVKKQTSYTQGYWLGVGIGLGAIIGLLIGLILLEGNGHNDGLSLGLAGGVGAGLIVGAGMEAKYNPKPKKLIDSKQHLLLTIVLFTGMLIMATILSLFIIAYT